MKRKVKTKFGKVEINYVYSDQVLDSYNNLFLSLAFETKEEIITKLDEFYYFSEEDQALFMELKEIIKGDYYLILKDICKKQDHLVLKLVIDYLRCILLMNYQNALKIYDDLKFLEINNRYLNLLLDILLIKCYVYLNRKELVLYYNDQLKKYFDLDNRVSLYYKVFNSFIFDKNYFNIMENYVFKAHIKDKIIRIDKAIKKKDDEAINYLLSIYDKESFDFKYIIALGLNIIMLRRHEIFKGKLGIMESLDYLENDLVRRYLLNLLYEYSKFSQVNNYLALVVKENELNYQKV